MFRRYSFRLSVLVPLAAVGAVMLGAPAYASEGTGPKTPQEAAICASVLAWAIPTSPAPTSVDAVCTVHGNGG
ncbi:hypothetical protein [Kitasatospora sp. NBC_00315]|uniref:hypothetical protein n=1 Tax=Kitasatospora sp. NBC_00315 TaxID=2975963 RepID=UPI0032516E05